MSGKHGDVPETASAGTSETPRLSCRDLRPAVQVWEARDGLNLDVMSGELLAVVGADGSGKSSLLRTMAGLDGPRTGEVLLDGQPVWSLPAGGSRPGVVTSRHRLRLDLPVRDNVLLARALSGPAEGKAPQEAELALAATGLADKAEAAAGSLSAAETHLAVIARELAAYPRLLLLDDPYPELDAEGRSRVASAAASARRRLGVAVVYASQADDELTATATKRLDLPLPAHRGSLGPPAPAAGAPAVWSPEPAAGIAQTVGPTASGPRWLAVEAYFACAGEQPAAALWAGPLTRCRDAVLVFRTRPRGGAGAGAPGGDIPPCIVFDLETGRTGCAVARAVPSDVAGGGRKGRSIRVQTARGPEGALVGSRPGPGATREPAPRREPQLTLLLSEPDDDLRGALQRFAAAGRKTVLPVIVLGESASDAPFRRVPYAYLQAEAPTANGVERALRRGLVVAAIPPEPRAGGPGVAGPAGPPHLYGQPQNVLAVHAARRRALGTVKRARPAGAPTAPGRLLAAYWALLHGNFGLVETVVE